MRWQHRRRGKGAVVTGEKLQGNVHIITTGQCKKTTLWRNDIPLCLPGVQTGFRGTLRRKAEGNVKNLRPWVGKKGQKQTTQGLNGLLAEGSAIMSTFIPGGGTQVIVTMG